MGGRDRGGHAGRHRRGPAGGANAMPAIATIASTGSVTSNSALDAAQDAVEQMLRLRPDRHRRGDALGRQHAQLAIGHQCDRPVVAVHAHVRLDHHPELLGRRGRCIEDGIVQLAGVIAVGERDQLGEDLLLRGGVRVERWRPHADQLGDLTPRWCGVVADVGEPHTQRRKMAPSGRDGPRGQRHLVDRQRRVGDAHLPRFCRSTDRRAGTISRHLSPARPRKPTGGTPQEPRTTRSSRSLPIARSGIDTRRRCSTVPSSAVFGGIPASASGACDAPGGPTR